MQALAGMSHILHRTSITCDILVHVMCLSFICYLPFRWNILYLYPACICCLTYHLHPHSLPRQIKMPPHNVDFKTRLKEIPEAELRRTQNIPHHTGGFGDVWQCIWSTSSSHPSVKVNPTSSTRACTLICLFLGCNQGSEGA